MVYSMSEEGSGLYLMEFYLSKFNLDDDEKIVLYIGRIHRIRGIVVLVKAFASVVEVGRG